MRRAPVKSNFLPPKTTNLKVRSLRYINILKSVIELSQLKSKSEVNWIKSAPAKQEETKAPVMSKAESVKQVPSVKENPLKKQFEEERAKK